MGWNNWVRWPGEVRAGAGPPKKIRLMSMRGRRRKGIAMREMPLAKCRSGQGISVSGPRVKTT